MNTNKYKSVSVSKDTYELLTNLAEKNDRTLGGTVKRMVEEGLIAAADEATIDCALLDGGTNRLKRLSKDLHWFKTYSGIGLNTKRFILNKEESKALDAVMEAVFDCGG